MDYHEFMSKFPKRRTMTSMDMFVLDENAEGIGITKDKLMENAGAAVARIIMNNFSALDEKALHVFCGLGNNGGDGFVVARHLAHAAKSITVYLLGDPSCISTPEARSNWKTLERECYAIHLISITDSTQLARLQGIDASGIIVDALLGAGINGDVREPIASAIRFISKASETFKCPIVAIDVPSGLNMDDGTAGNPVVKASRTVTFHLQKKGMAARQDITGDIDIMPIGIPPEADWLVGKGDVKSILKHRRDSRSFKGMNGKVLIIGGSKQYSGAPILSALAASRCGVDLVNLCIPGSHTTIARTASPDLIVSPLEGDSITEMHVTEIEPRVQWADAVLIGPGMGREPGTAHAILALCDITIKAGKRLVVDADALKAIATNIKPIDSPNVIITPHAGEFAIVAGMSPSNLNTLENKLQAAFDFTRERRCQLVLKGPEDIVMNQHRCKINLVHTPAMTVGGTGDVLAGLAVALASIHGTSPERMFAVSCAAIHINGLVGQLVEQQQRGPFITASMMIENIGTVLSRFA
jgi:hydroxyethylthiazole kinase-like uncharacterized protein yjeF